MTMLANDTSNPENEESISLGTSLFLMPIAVVFICFWLMFGIIISSDPYDVYDWGSAPELLIDYDRRDVDYLYSAAAKTDVDLLVLGGSTLASIQAIDIISTFPDIKTAFNFSPTGTRPFDRKIMFDLMIAHSPAEHVIVGLDWVYALPIDINRPAFPSYLYDANRLNDLRMVTPTSLVLALRKLAGGPLALPGWEFSDQLSGDARAYERFQSKDNIASLSAQVKKGPAYSVSDRTFSCDDFPLVKDVMMPALEKFVESGRKADILIPPSALILYHTWQERNDSAALLANPFLDMQLAMRRCVTDLASGTPRIRVFAFDTDPAITADISNYRDAGHLFDTSVLKQILTDVAAGRNMLTPQNFDAYADGLIDMVKGLPLASKL